MISDYFKSHNRWRQFFFSAKEKNENPGNLNYDFVCFLIRPSWFINLSVCGAGIVRVLGNLALLFFFSVYLGLVNGSLR